MTATPIPRTLTLTLYGDLDVGVLDEMPPGRLPVATSIVRTDAGRESAYRHVRYEAQQGKQTFIICPLVEDSVSLEVKAAESEYERVRTEVFPDLRVGLIHGRMTGQMKDDVMTKMRDGELDVLVSTTVIEVGVDIPNATVMIIEDADRFGLSQLHQLRGRVGRDRHQSYCFLLYQSPLSDEARERLKAMTETTDGFEIAERDLVQRGPGDFFGTRQAGVPTFRMIDLVRDRDVLDLAHREAGQWFATVKPAADAIERLLANWNQRFRLIAIG